MTRQEFWMQVFLHTVSQGEVNTFKCVAAADAAIEEFDKRWNRKTEVNGPPFDEVIWEKEEQEKQQ